MPFERTDRVKYAPRAGRYPHMRATRNHKPAYLTVPVKTVRDPDLNEGHYECRLI